MNDMNPWTKRFFILCATLILILIVVGVFRAIVVGALTVDDILKIIGAWKNKEALIHGI